MTNITPEEVKQRLDAGEKLNLVDVREPHENAECAFASLRGRDRSLKMSR